MTPFIVYRDLLFARSEAFIPRMYRAFAALHPLYLGSRLAVPAPPDGHEVHRLCDRLPGGRLGEALYRQSGWAPQTLAGWAQASGAALIHAHFGRGGALALPLAQATGLPLVVTFHGGDATKDKHYRERPLIPTIYQRRRRALAERADLVLCVSEFIRRKLIERGFAAEKLRTHHLGIEVPERLERLPAPSSRRLLFVGRFVAKKGVEDLLAAAATLGAAGEAVEVVVVGDGPLRPALEARARALGIRHRFTGWLEPALVAREMAAAHALVVPSRTADGGDAEGIPTVIYEAQARGLPVVATRHAGIPEVVSDGETGFLVDEGSPDALAAALGRSFRDPELYRGVQRRARRSVGENFDADRQSARLEAILLEVAGAHRAAPAPRPRVA